MSNRHINHFFNPEEGRICHLAFAKRVSSYVSILKTEKTADPQRTFELGRATAGRARKEGLQRRYRPRISSPNVTQTGVWRR